jgi:RNA polymerase sigma factor (sigma-70 family)
MTAMSTGPSTSAEAGRAERSARLGALLDRAKNGERAALNEVVRELNPLLWHVARSQGLGVEEASDVVQTVWLELLRRLYDIRSSQALTAWLVTTTRREAWRVQGRLRQQVPHAPEAFESAVDPEPEPSERLLSDERDRALWRHFQRLPERCRTLLRVVAQVDRPDYAMLAEALEMPHGSIGPTRGRCLAKLREMLLADPQWRQS